MKVESGVADTGEFGAVADGDHEIHMLRIGRAEFVPALAAQLRQCVAGAGDLLDGQGIDDAGRPAASREPLDRPRPMVDTSASAMMLRAELPVHRNSTLYTLSSAAAPATWPTGADGGDAALTSSLKTDELLSCARPDSAARVAAVCMMAGG